MSTTPTAPEVADLIERMEEEGMRLAGYSIDQGSVDAGLTANLAEEAATALRSIQADRERLAERVAELEKVNASCDWYWPEDDTSSDACADSHWAIAESVGLKPGEILGYSRGGIVETRYYAFLPPAEDADSDNEFEVDETSEEAVISKINAEKDRRALLSEARTND